MLALLGLMITEKHDQGWLIHQQQVGPDPESCPFGTMLLLASLELNPTSLTDIHSLQMMTSGHQGGEANAPATNRLV